MERGADLQEAERKEREELEQAVGHFIMTLGYLEGVLTVAIGHIVGAGQPASQFLLSKTAGGQKADLLEKALLAKGYPVAKKTPLKLALNSVQDIMGFRNRLVHDAVAFHRDERKWFLGKGAAAGDKHFGSRCELTPGLLKDYGDRAVAAVRVIALETGLPYVE